MEGTQELYRIHDEMLLYCISKWPECPKGKFCRRITRNGGQRGAEKLAADIVVLTRYGSSGVLYDEVADIFQKPRSVDKVLDSILDSSSLNQGGSEVSKELTKNVTALLEEMDLKLCEAKENYLESIDDMKIEVENLKACLTERDPRIDKITKQQETKEIQGEHCPTASTNKGSGGERSYANVICNLRFRFRCKQQKF